MSDTILSTLASKPCSGTSEDQIYQIIVVGGADGKEKTEQKTLKQEESCGVEDICEDGEETDNSSAETNPNSGMHEYRLSPVKPSPSFEEAGAAGGGGEHLLHGTRFF